MTPEQKQAIERFCNNIVSHDAWMWRKTCAEILANADYSGPACLRQSGKFYDISFFMVSGQAVTLSRMDGGWSFDWGRPLKKSCENLIHYAEGGDIICPDCGEAV